MSKLSRKDQRKVLRNRMAEESKQKAKPYIRLYNKDREKVKLVNHADGTPPKLDQGTLEWVRLSLLGFEPGGDSPLWLPSVWLRDKELSKMENYIAAELERQIKLFGDYRLKTKAKAGKE